MQLALLLLSAALSNSAFGGAPDELFPGGGQFGMTVATGVPYLAIAEVDYGMGDRFALGAIAGLTPITYGIGLRPRALMLQGAAGQLVVSAPLLYYPATGTLGHEPWVLAMPQLLGEHRFGNGFKAHLGVGVAAATCTGAIAEFFGGAHEHESDEGFMGGVWNTVTIGGSIPGAGFRVFADASLVLHGLRLAKADWIGGPPVVVTIGVRLGL